MPTYEYVCEACGEDFDVFQSMKDEKLKKCPKCGQLALKRKIGCGAGIVFHGHGFYCTDFKNNNSTAAKKA